jgi:NAD(P)-dependent dehydrogenase (short-subunit alcohol dehydrogenase family)
MPTEHNTTAVHRLDEQSHNHALDTKEANMPRTIVITGTSSGFGKLTVERFAAEGWNVVATVRKDSDLAVHTDLPGVRTLLLNVDDEQADLAFADLAIQQFGRVDALVNNAGYYQAGPLEATAMDQVHRQFQTNVFGLIALNKASHTFARRAPESSSTSAPSAPTRATPTPRSTRRPRRPSSP